MLWSCLLAIALMFASPGLAASRDAGPSDELMEEALGTLGLVIGRDLSAEDQTWLRERWAMEAADRPEQMVEGLEAFAVARKGIEAGTDPMVLAELRTQVIDESYCATKRTSDAETWRMRSILAPDDLVLVADCITGVVVTPFDVKALARSNAMVGELVGSPVDAAATEAEILKALPHAFDEAPLELQQRLLWGELRAAALDVLWSSVDETTREELAAAARDTFKSNEDVAVTTLAFEKTALKKVGEVTAIARADEYWFSLSELASYFDFIEFVAGTSLSPGERAEITDMYVSDFHEDPKRTVEVAANLRYWLDNGYYWGKDPVTGQTRSWTAEEQARMRAEEAALLFCSSEKSGDPADKRFIEIIFADNPVIDVDCVNNRITRDGDRVLAGAGDKQLTRAMLDRYRQNLELIFAVQFSADERRWFDEASVKDMRNNPVGMIQVIDGFQRTVDEIKEPAQVGPHINEQRREDNAIRIYCANKGTEDPEVARLFDIINDHDPVLFEDCERLAAVRESDVGGLVSMLNFVGSLGDFEPLTEDEIAAWPDKIKPFFETRTGGSFGYLSTFAKLSYWWSRMPVGARHRTVAMIKEEVTSRDGVDAYVPTLSARASYQTNSQALCDFQMKKLSYDTKRVGLSSRTIIDTNPNANSPWVNPEAIDDDVAFYGIMAPFVQEQCGNVWN